MSSTDVNFCPCCGANIRAVNMALSFAAAPKTQVKAELPQPKPKPLKKRVVPAGRKIWSAEMVERIRELREQGKKPKDIADELGQGLTSQQVSNIIQYHLRGRKDGEAA